MIHDREKELDLVRKCTQQDLDRIVLDEFVKYYSDLVYGTIYKTWERFGNPVTDDVGDIYQEVFKSLFNFNRKALKNFDPQKALFSTYLYKITKNKTLKYISRFYKNSLEEVPAGIGIFEKFDDEIDQNRKLNTIMELVEGLTVKEKLFFKLYYQDYLPESDIASILGIDVGTVYSKKAKLIKKLQAMVVEKESSGI